MSSSSASEIEPSGKCDTSLGSQGVQQLKSYCEAYTLDVTPTGKYGPIKTDYVSAIYTYNMGLTDLETGLQDRIRIFISWLIKKTVKEMHHVASKYFSLDCAAYGRKGDICARLLDKVSQDPELPDIPELCNMFKGLKGVNEKVQSSRKEAVEHWRNAIPDLGAQKRQDVLASMFQKMCTTTGQEPQTIPEDPKQNKTQASEMPKAQAAPPPAKHPVTPTATATATATPSATPSKTDASKNGVGKLDDVIQKLREITSALEQSPNLAYLLAPALVQIAERLGNGQ